MNFLGNIWFCPIIELGYFLLKLFNSMCLDGFSVQFFEHQCKDNPNLNNVNCQPQQFKIHEMIACVEQNASFFLANAADFFERISFHREWFSLYTNTLCTHQTRFSLFWLSRASPHFLNDAKSGKRFLCLATMLTGCCFKQSVKKMLPK